MWRFRRSFWNRLLIFKFRAARPLKIPRPPKGERYLRPVPFAKKFPKIPITGLVVADHVPWDEARSQLLALPFCRFQAFLNRAFSPMQAGLPPIESDPTVALDTAYTSAHRRCYPAPSRPGDFEDDVLLGRLALDSPYAGYLQHFGNGVYGWDLEFLKEFDCHAGLVRPMAKVEFEFDPSAKGVRPAKIYCELGEIKPQDPEWPLAQRLALCAATTHLSLVHHFNWIHLVCGGPLAIVTRNRLPAEHPIRRFLQPHVFGTQSSNEMVTLVQMSRGGDFENTFSFTHKGMCDLFEATSSKFDIRIGDPEASSQQRDVTDVVGDSPAMANRRALMQVMRNHAARYLECYFDSDDALIKDDHFSSWIEDLESHIRKGVPDLVGSPVTLQGASRLLAALIYLVTVEHEIVGSGMWNYQLWSDVQPVRVRKDGRLPSLDVYQRAVNANFNLNVRRTPLMSDFSCLAEDPKGKAVFARFLSDLRALQATMDNEKPTCWRIEPQMLKANINA